ncbi:MAG: hypothetical protein P4L50_11850, partial [Anaerolineaceae bacterium]|nr:hypothetical protein [Anaerolineaceae bacterium]
KTLHPVITLRSERGYLAANYDASTVKSPKTLRCQSSRSYDVKKVRNSNASKPDSQQWVSLAQAFGLDTNGVTCPHELMNQIETRKRPYGFKCLA